ncbi:glutathione S-transferase [uncultured Methylobacterium sp.]|jgi:glutathione S-transferase|uniref:glutathione S-transferase n=1 Tax=uncultured Methylobacterium sp. TaxID=157278 RepID=UPI00260E822E|nr:glutathione S-transferase [uncultured Methylobacterium sp.]
MRLIGMLDSPYVRRVAISLRAMGIGFDHEPLSVFRDFEAFAALNAVVKAPTLVLDDGTVLLDSTLILDTLDRVAVPDLRLAPTAQADFVLSQRLIGLALTACEKSVQIVYERNLRPIEKQHQPWLDRVERQLLAAFDLLEDDFAQTAGWRFAERPLQADITAAVTWRFTQSVLAETVPAYRYPSLASLSRRAEARSEFSAFPIE